MSVKKVTDIADCLLSPPGAGNIAALKKYQDSCSSALSCVGLVPFVDTGTLAERTLTLRNGFFDRMTVLRTVRLSALQHGYVLPDDPTGEILKLNVGRARFSQVSISIASAASYISALKDLSDVADAVTRGDLDLSVTKGGLGQLSSFDMSVDGIVSSPTGDALADILGYQPDADSILKMRAAQALSMLDFSKRRPSLIAVVDELSDRLKPSKSICWRRMHDASGYKVTRRNVFTDVEKISTLKAESVTVPLTPSLIEVISFYDDITPADVCVMTDVDIETDMLYAYSVSGLQTSAGGARKTYDVQTTPLYLSPDQIVILRERITHGGDPYPTVSQIVYGNERYDWLLACVNFLGARMQGLDQKTVRLSSYLGATVDSVIASLTAGTFLSPTDIQALITAVETSIATNGVSQTILDAIDASGVGIFTTGEDPSGFQSGSDAIDLAAAPIIAVLSSIDSQTATIDPAVLISNLSAGRPNKTVHKSVGMASMTTVSISDIVGNQIIDVTTFDGISDLLRVIRLYTDAAGRGDIR